MIHRTNYITICLEDYKSEQDWWDGVRDAVKVLLENKYIITVDLEDAEFGIICINYDYADREIGGPRPVWLTPDEEDSVVWDKERNNSDDE